MQFNQQPNNELITALEQIKYISKKDDIMSRPGTGLHGLLLSYSKAAPPISKMNRKI